MSTPKDAHYKLRQRAAHPETFVDVAEVARYETAHGGPATIKARDQRVYVVDPRTGQWWRPEAWAARKVDPRS